MAMREKLQRINDYEWLLPKSVRKEMRVDAKVIMNKALIDSGDDSAFEQLTNVATLPGVVEPVVGLPDMHWGYGLPMGAVSAFDEKEGIISAGLCGFDINCGVNLIRTNLTADEVRKHIKELVPALFKAIPCGVGATGKLRLQPAELNEVLTHGVKWAVEKGYATK
ncbi:MAG TPA: RtcB family protein, partial [archaeon]|nr:RtcB family protein [archaeon]